MIVTTEPVMPGMDDHLAVVRSITVAEHLRGRQSLDECQENCKRQGIGHVRVRMA